MKKQCIFMIAFLVNCMIAFVACSSKASTNNDKEQKEEAKSQKLRVVSTIFPSYDFVRQIAEDKVELTMLLSPGSESHSFEPTPKDIITIQNCDVFLYVGGESDAWVDDILSSMDTSKMKIISLLDLVEVVEEEYVEGMEHSHDDEHEEENDHDEEHSEEAHIHQEEVELDEHVWTSPKNAITIVEKLKEVLCQLDSENQSFYTEHANDYVEQLQQIDESLEEVMKESVRNTVIFGDRFPFRYLADAYGLEYYAAFPGCSTETEASAATIAFLIDQVKQEQIPVVFYIEFSNEKIADAICEATGAKKLLLHSCHNITKSDFEQGIGYVDLMKQNIKHLKEVLS